MSAQQDPDLDGLIEALRGDVPSERDRDRMRRKLIAAGIAVSAGSALSGAVVAKASAATASAGTSVGVAGASVAGAGVAGASVVAKLAGLSLSAKISAGALVLASASALSVYDAGERSSRSSAREPVTEAVAAAPALEPAAHVPEEPAAIEPSVVVTPAPAPIAAVAAPARLRSQARRARPDTAQRAPLAAIPVHEEPLAAPTPRAPASAPLASALRAEAELLERALSALHAGELESARRALSAHAERFPQGALRRERERAHQQLTLLVATRTDR
jgi:hypothetical protein